MTSTGWAPMQTGVLIRREDEATDRHRGKALWGYREKMAIHTPSREASCRHLDLQLPAPGAPHPQWRRASYRLFIDCSCLAVTTQQQHHMALHLRNQQALLQRTHRYTPARPFPAPMRVSCVAVH